MAEVLRLKPGVSGADIREGPKPAQLAEVPPPAPPEPVPSVSEIEGAVRDMSLADDGSDIFMAAVLLVGAAHVGTRRLALRKWSSYPIAKIRHIHRNLRAKGIWTSDQKLAYFSSDEPEIVAIEFCLLAMAGAGIVVRTP